MSSKVPVFISAYLQCVVQAVGGAVLETCADSEVTTGVVRILHLGAAREHLSSTVDAKLIAQVDVLGKELYRIISDVTIGTWRLISLAIDIFAQQPFQTINKEIISVPHDQPFWGPLAKNQ